MSPTREYQPGRYVASVPRHQAPHDALTGDSLNWLIDPREKKATRRRGQTTPPGWDSVLNTAWTGNVPRGRQIIGMRADQLTDKSQHPTVLFTDDESDPRRGEIVTYDSTAADWYSLGHEYGTTHYPTVANYYGGTGAAGSGLALNFRWTPMWSNATTGNNYLRGITSTDRNNMLGGGRANMEVGGFLFGMSDSTPWMWNKTWNFASDSGSNINRRRPWGHQVPLYHPTVVAAGGTSSVKAWRKGHTFYYSVAFMFEDGSVGPFTDVVDSVAEGMLVDGMHGRYTIPITSDYFTHIAYTTIPRGGKGCIARVLARTSQVDTAAGLNATYPGPNDLRIVTIIRNNTQTTYNDYQGDDETLTATPDLVRIDHKWPRRGKYLVANDGRFLMCGSLKPHPAAIIIAPTGVLTSRDIDGFSTTAPINDPDSQRVDEYKSSPGTRGFFVRLTSANLNLYFDTGATINSVNISLSTYTTLRQMVDRINSFAIDYADGKEWAAHVVPGADPDATVANLEYTEANIKADDNVRSPRLVAGAVPSDTYAWTRGPSDPFIIYFNKTYLDAQKTDDQAVEWTRGGPSDTPSAILNWSASKECERSPKDAFVGRCLGAAPIGNMFVVFYERGIYMLRSVKEGNADEDLRLIPIAVGNVHVVSDSSIFWGDGFAGCMTHQGVIVIDESGDYRMISEDVYNHEKVSSGLTTPGVGEWKNEIAASLKATQAGGRTTADDESFCYGAVLSDQIHISYRKTATAACDRRIVNDFSANAEAKGLAAVLDRGRPFGWSCPLTTTVGVMAEIADQSGGMVRYGVVDNVAQGRVDKFDSALTDNNSLITATGYFATDFMETLLLKAAEQLVVLYAKNGSGLSLVLARDQGSSPAVHGVDTFSKTLDSSGDDLYARKLIDLQPEARTPTDVFELRIVDDGNNEPPEVWRAALTYEVLEFPR